jgi:hypothetical protein
MTAKAPKVPNDLVPSDLWSMVSKYITEIDDAYDELWWPKGGDRCENDAVVPVAYLSLPEPSDDE